jgi:hypothetical protein
MISLVGQELQAESADYLDRGTESDPTFSSEIGCHWQRKSDANFSSGLPQ